MVTTPILYVVNDPTVSGHYRYSINGHGPYSVVIVICLKNTGGLERALRHEAFGPINVFPYSSSSTHAPRQVMKGVISGCRTFSHAPDK